MEQIDAYGDIREAPLGEGDKAAVHVTAEEADASALLRRVVPKIGEQVFKVHAGENVDNAAGRAVGEIAVETVDIPTAGILIIHPGRTLKLINTQGMRKESRLGEVNGAQDRKHLGFREDSCRPRYPEETVWS